MYERHRWSLNFLKVFDQSMVVLTFAVSTALIVRHEHTLSLAQFLSIRTKVSNFAIFALFLAICHFVLLLYGRYRTERRTFRNSGIVDAMFATTACTLSAVALGSLFSIQMITPRFLEIFWVLGALTLYLSRMVVRILVGCASMSAGNLHYILIVGTNPQAVAFARRIVTNRDRGHCLLGFVDDEWPGLAEFNRSGFRLVTSFAGLPEFLRRNVVDEAAIYLPRDLFFHRYSDLANLFEQHGIPIRFSTEIFRLKTARPRTEVFDGDHYIATYRGASEGVPQLIKRVLDIVVSGLFILFLIPVMACVAIAIKLTSRGPVFFLQERLGLNKRHFKIIKFRTMVQDAERLIDDLARHNEMGGPAFKMKNDPRVTTIGRFLRRTSLDELPQFFNVFKGDMSLVGPRPLPLRDYDGFSEDWQRRRFSVKPGITCLWQVNGRSGISFDQWMRLDLQYMDEWSLWLDLKILAKTLPAVIKGAGAV